MTGVRSWCTLLATAVLALSGCEKKTRANAGAETPSVVNDEEQLAKPTQASVYRFVSSEQTLEDARKALADERWEDALGASAALLKQSPGSAEATQIAEKAKLEGPNKARYTEFTKALASRDVQKSIRFFNTMSEVSGYKAKARPELEKLKTDWIDAQETEAKTNVRVGRCEDARRIARVTIEAFSDARDRMEGVVTTCKPAEVAVAAPRKDTKDKGDKDNKKATKDDDHRDDPPANQGGSATPKDEKLASITPPKHTQPDIGKSTPDQQKTVTEPTKAPETPRPTLAPKNVSMGELEQLRIAGEAKPDLASGARQITNRDGVPMVVLAVRVCVSESGAPTVVNLVKSSDYADANEKILADVRRWRFKPYVKDGHATPVCTSAVFQYDTRKGRNCGPRGSVGVGCQ